MSEDIDRPLSRPRDRARSASRGTSTALLGRLSSNGLSIARCGDEHHHHPRPGGQTRRAAARLAAEEQRDLGLPLISVTFVEPGHPQAPDAETNRQLLSSATKKETDMASHRPNRRSEFATGDEKDPDDLDKEAPRSSWSIFYLITFILDPHAQPLRPHQEPPGPDPRHRRPHRRAGGRLPRGDRRPRSASAPAVTLYPVVGGKGAEERRRSASPVPLSASWKPSMIFHRRQPSACCRW